MAKRFELLSKGYLKNLTLTMQLHAKNPSTKISDPLLPWLAQNVELTYPDWKTQVLKAQQVPTNFGALLKKFLKRLRDVYVEGDSFEPEPLPEAFWPWLALVLHPPPGA